MENGDETWGMERWLITGPLYRLHVTCALGTPLRGIAAKRWVRYSGAYLHDHFGLRALSWATVWRGEPVRK